jgi:prepilin-type N-terminal cleavage/methylation domain-containing protein
MAPQPRTQRGFSLLEVMIALGLLAFIAGAVASNISVSAAHIHMRNKMVIATQLVRGIVLDIEEEHQLEFASAGEFPDSKEDQECEVPEPWDNVFDCSYDLVALESNAEVMSELANSGMMGMLGQDPTALMGGAGTDPAEMLAMQQNVDITKMMALAPLFGDQGPQVIATCGINLPAMMMSMMGIQQFFPEIVRQAANQTRKLTVRLSYPETPGTDRTLTIETFIVAIPREELKQMEQRDNANDLINPEGFRPAGAGAIRPEPGNLK